MVLDLLRWGFAVYGFPSAPGRPQWSSPPALVPPGCRMPLSAGSLCLSWPHGFFDPKRPHTPITFCWVTTAASAATVTLPQSTCSYLPRGSFKITALSWSFDVLRLLAPHWLGAVGEVFTVAQFLHPQARPPFWPQPCSAPRTLISFPATLSPLPASQSRDRSKPASTRHCSFLLVFKTPCCPNFPLPVSLPPLLLPFSAHPQNVSVPLGWILVCPYSICTFFLGDCPPSHNLTCDIHTDGLKCVSEAQASL